MAHEIHFSCGFEPGRCNRINEKTDEFLAKGYELTPYAYQGLPKLEFWGEAVAVWVFEDQHSQLTADLTDNETIEILNWVKDIVAPSEDIQTRPFPSVPIQ